MGKFADARGIGVRGREASGYRWWLGLAALVLACAIVAVLFGAPSWALPFEQTPSILGNGPLAEGTLGSISGHVLLEARPAPPTDSWSIPLQLTLYHGDGTVYTATIVMTDNEGTFSVGGIAADTYDVWLKGAHTLAERQNDITVGLTPIVQLEFGPLIEGDANNDNQIGAVDASFLSNGYWKSRGEAGFVTGADFNEDGTIDARDASLLAAHYGLGGE